MNEKEKQASWNPDIYPPSLQQAMSAVIFLVTTGYPTEDVTLEVVEDCVSLRLVVENKAYRCVMGKPEHGIELMEELWKEMLLQWNKSGEVTMPEANAFLIGNKANESRDMVRAMVLISGVAAGKDLTYRDWLN